VHKHISRKLTVEFNLLCNSVLQTEKIKSVVHTNVMVARLLPRHVTLLLNFLPCFLEQVIEQ